MATRTARKTKPRSKPGIGLNEFAGHFLDILNAIHTGEVQGIAMTGVTADSPNSDTFRTMSSTLTRHGRVAWLLRDVTSDLWPEKETRR